MNNGLRWLGLTYELEPELQLLKLFLPLFATARAAGGPAVAVVEGEREVGGGKKAGSWEARGGGGGEESSPAACNTPASAIGGVATTSEIGSGDNVRNDTRF